MSAPRRLLARLRDLMAHGEAPLAQLVSLVAAELVSEVCSIYVHRPGDLLELAATEGLRATAIGRTRLRVGEGIVGLVAATGSALNLPDAQNHPAFAYRPETGEERYASMLAVPVRRAGRTLGVLAVQNRTVRRYDADEMEVLETVAMLLAELLAASGVEDGASEGLAATTPRRFAATVLVPGLAMGPAVIHGAAAAPRRLMADDPLAEQARLSRAVAEMQRGLDELIAAQLPRARSQNADAAASREILDAYRLVAADAGWLKRVAEAIRSGLTAEAAVHRVTDDLRDRMRRVVDPYLRERLSDLEDLAVAAAGRTWRRRSGGAGAAGCDRAGATAGAGGAAGLARPRSRRRGGDRRQRRRARRDPGSGARHPGRRRRARAAGRGGGRRPRDPGRVRGRQHPGALPGDAAAGARTGAVV